MRSTMIQSITSMISQQHMKLITCQIGTNLHINNYLLTFIFFVSDRNFIVRIIMNGKTIIH
jgi:hypothetical protein